MFGGAECQPDLGEVGGGREIPSAELLEAAKSICERVRVDGEREGDRLVVPVPLHPGPDRGHQGAPVGAVVRLDGPEHGGGKCPEPRGVIDQPATGRVGTVADHTPSPFLRSGDRPERLAARDVKRGPGLERPTRPGADPLEALDETSGIGILGQEDQDLLFLAEDEVRDASTGDATDERLVLARGRYPAKHDQLEWTPRIESQAAQSASRRHSIEDAAKQLGERFRTLPSDHLEFVADDRELECRDGHDVLHDGQPGRDHARPPQGDEEPGGSGRDGHRQGVPARDGRRPIGRLRDQAGELRRGRGHAREQRPSIRRAQV